MIAYKFLAQGAVGPFTGFSWPVPARGRPGSWVVAPEKTAAEQGIHACRKADLSYWTDAELWTIELGGPIYEHRIQVVAGRARLLGPVTLWDEESRKSFAEVCLFRTRDAIARALRSRGEPHHAGRLAQCAEIEDLARVATELAPSHPLVAYVLDARACLGDCGAAACVAAKAAAAAEPEPHGAADTAERQGQSRWLVEHLGLS